MITVSLDELLIGGYNFTIILSDTYGNTAKDTVIVTVLPATDPTSPFDILDIFSFTITIGSLAVIVIIATVACRSRRVGQWEGQFG